MADELRANALLSPPRAPGKDKSSQRPSPPPQPVSQPTEREPCSLEGKKLGTQASPGPHRKGLTQTFVPAPAGRSLPPSGSSGGSFGPTDWFPQTLDSLPYSSQDCLDSGIGSLESQMSELWGVRGGAPGEPGPPRGPYAGYNPYGAELPATPAFSAFGRAVGAGHFSVPAEMKTCLGVPSGSLQGWGCLQIPANSSQTPQGPCFFLLPSRAPFQTFPLRSTNARTYQKCTSKTLLETPAGDPGGHEEKSWLM